MIKFAKSWGLEVIRAYVSMQCSFPLPSISFYAQSSPEFLEALAIHIFLNTEARNSQKLPFPKRQHRKTQKVSYVFSKCAFDCVALWHSE